MPRLGDEPKTSIKTPSLYFSPLHHRGFILDIKQYYNVYHIYHFYHIFGTRHAIDMIVGSMGSY